MDRAAALLSQPRSRSLVLVGVSALSVSTLLWFFKKPLWRLIRGATRRRRSKKKLGVNVGAIFGMDVGGTLTKIVYFQPKRPDQQDPALLAEGTVWTSSMRRMSSDHLAQLDSPDHKAALQELYTYMESTSQKGNGVMTRDGELTVYSPYLEGQLHFVHFETRNMITAINVLSSATVIDHVKSIGATGGGAHKYANQILEELEITVNKFDELGCLVRGMHFALTNFPDECYTYRCADAPARSPEEHGETSPSVTSDKADNATGEASPPKVSEEQPPKRKESKEYTKKVFLPYRSLASFPYLVVNIGSGVSILKVSSPGVFERVSGTSLGGGTYWGLCRLLTNAATYDHLLDIAETGDASTVDMLVKDIYGGDYTNMLTGSMVASSFGKLVMKERPREGVCQEDLALALLMMITNNIGQIAYLNAQLHQCSKIFFVGSFLRHNPISCRRLSFAIDFWSGGSMDALFLTHEGYFGALGTFLQSLYGNEVDKILESEEDCKTRDPVALSLNPPRDGTSAATEDDASSPKGWGRNIAKIAKWSASHFKASPASTPSKRASVPSRESQSHRRRSSSDDFYVKSKSLSSK